MTLRKKPHLTACRSYDAGMTHIVHDVDRLGSKLHKKEIAESVSVLEAAPIVVAGFVGSVETLRACGPPSGWVVCRSCGLTDDKTAEEVFRWPLSHLADVDACHQRGSTIGMKAINGNSYNSLIKAVGNAPRGKQTLWLLNIQVGTQSITPLMWSVETGSMEPARPISTGLRALTSVWAAVWMGCV